MGDPRPPHPPDGRLTTHRLDGLVVKACASKKTDPGFDSRFPPGDFSGPSRTGDLNIGTPVAYPAKCPELGRVGPVSVFCDWVREKV